MAEHLDCKKCGGVKKQRNNLVYTSSYERGLIPILEMWPELLKEVPDVTLDVAYGFEMYDKTPWGKKPSGQAWKQQVMKLLDQPGITHHGRLGTNEVAELYKKADVWAYPTTFPEISCITAMKAQAAGAVPIVLDFAALKETVRGGIILEGSGHDPKVLEMFKNELISLLKDDKCKEALRSKLNVDDFSWDVVAEQWDTEFKS